ncbi:MAG: amidohydrolase [Lachnospiraceae bacterium]|nr:amidohydrolase [Lachnospiraceae bacterium]
MKELSFRLQNAQPEGGTSVDEQGNNDEDSLQENWKNTPKNNRGNNRKNNDKNQYEVLDAEGGWVMPGLIDAHCHVGISEEKWGIIGDDCNEMTDPLTPQLRAVDGVNPMDPAFHDAIMGGITTVMTGPGSSNVVGGQAVLLKTQGRCIDHMILKAPAAMKVAFGENPKVNYGDKDQMPGTRMAIAGMLRQELHKAQQYAAAKNSGQNPEENFKLESYLPVIRGEIPLKAHAHRADDILTAIRIAKEFGVKMTLDHCTEGHLIADEVAASGFPVILGPHLSSRSKLEIQNLSFKTAGVMERAGVLFAIMSDHPVTLIRYLPLYAGLAVKQGLSMEGGLKALTIHAAKICGADDRIGSIREGKDADLAVFTDNPMFTLTKTMYTVIDGKVVYDWKDEVKTATSK